MFYYLYEIRNNLNDKIYIGVHKTKNMNDCYMGSGKIILSAIQKYGIENFTKTILETFETAEDMYARELEVVTEDFLLRADVYNLRRGGTGGFDYINNSGIIKFGGKRHTSEAKDKIRKSNTGRKLTQEAITKIKKNNEVTNESRGNKVSNALSGKPKTHEHNRNVSISISKWWKNRKMILEKQC